MAKPLIRTAGSAIIVEMMRNGMSPQKACELGIERIIEKTISDLTRFTSWLFSQLNKGTGEYGGFAQFYKGFNLCFLSGLILMNTKIQNLKSRKECFLEWAIESTKANEACSNFRC